MFNLQLKVKTVDGAYEPMDEIGMIDMMINRKDLWGPIRSVGFSFSASPGTGGGHSSLASGGPWRSPVATAPSPVVSSLLSRITDGVCTVRCVRTVPKAGKSVLRF